MHILIDLSRKRSRGFTVRERSPSKRASKRNSADLEALPTTRGRVPEELLRANLSIFSLLAAPTAIAATPSHMGPHSAPSWRYSGENCKL
ncbi:hypothetical protein J6590_031934 [Homalodisca vitripennis]|nr:hypothetical protein J6590_031934 [Homalodisca vitripennis]